MPPLVHIIVITCNGRQHLEGCFSSLRQTEYPNYRVWLVDNASADGSSEYVAQHFPEVSVWRNQRNLGFARGNNLAMEKALDLGADYILLLNDDTAILDPRWLAQAVELAEREPLVGMIGFQLLSTPAPPAVPATLPAVNVAVAHIPGCSLFMRASLLRAIGLLDEVYFAYAEEDDLEMRAMRAGAQLRRIELPVYHYGGGTSKNFPVWTSYLQMRNSIRFSIKQRSLWRTLRRIGKIIDLSCNPFPFFLNVEDTSHLRVRAGGNVLLNSFVLLGAIGWNILFLPQTLWIRRREGRQIAAAQTLLKLSRFQASEREPANASSQRLGNKSRNAQ